jgi:hypothetical protein
MIDYMEPYENYPITGRVYEHAYDLLDRIPSIKEEKAIIFLINWPYGFGSALTIHIQNAIFLNNINKELIVLPHYSNNSRNFKYHDKADYNSFFRYFKYNHSVDMNRNIYFVKTAVFTQIPRINYTMPFLSDQTNREQVNYFLSNFTPIWNEKVRTYIDSVKENDKPLIGIHIRSIAQKHMEDDKYLLTSLDKRLEDLKKKIENKHPNAIIFIATDVYLYIEKMKALFGRVHFLDYIKRIYNEGDSIPQLDRYCGSILGRDIMDECYGLSLCDKVYMSNSNIPFIVTMMNRQIELEEY